MPTCNIGTTANPNLPVCLDSQNPANHDYFKLIDHNMPVGAKISSGTSPKVDRSFNFCVDDTSAILRSGVHYGDKGETLDEWKTPVTIIGSHDCRMLFFEPMISWKWISGRLKYNGYWPSYQVSDIRYNRKTFDALPHSWGVTVTPGCEAAWRGPCRIQITVEGTKCPPGGCTIRRECGGMTSCATNAPYVSPFVASNVQPTVTSTSTRTTSTGTSTTTRPGTSPAARASSGSPALRRPMTTSSTTDRPRQGPPVDSSARLPGRIVILVLLCLCSTVVRVA